MEYSRVGSLESIMKRKRHCTEDELCEIASCCLLGLDSLHKKGIMHGVSDCDGDELIGRETRESVSLRTWCGETGLLWIDN